MIDFVKKPSILLPNETINHQKWAVVACDQFTSQPEYWNELSAEIDGEYSTLNLIFPEVYLNSDKDAYTKKINQNMTDYYNNGIFVEENNFILVKRTIQNGKIRLGLMLEVDLEHYEYTESNNAYIKATEKTVVERLPIRIDIRKNATIELPHIMLLLDDPNKTIIEELYADSDNMEVVYDFELNMGGGHICGYRVPQDNKIIEKLSALINPEVLQERYNTDKHLLFAVGDGNHSLATAKECWNQIKKSIPKKEQVNHPARYALCELVNLHDESLVFEPIHRVIFNADEDFVVEMTKSLEGMGRLKVTFNDTKYVLNVPQNPADAIKDIQDFIDYYISEHPNCEQDYIHGDEYLESVALKNNGVAIFMPTIEKDSLFSYVIRRGVLPRKSFSMGIAEDKRYYMECRKITK